MKTKVYLFAVGLLAACSASAINLDMVRVGDAGNANDTTGYGGVDYEYNIGTYEVTNAQYAEFLNSVAKTSDTHSLYNGNMGSSSFGGITRSGSAGNYTYSAKSGSENKPVNYVSFWDAARFTNWLTNGQPTGVQGALTTETGVYNLGGGAITRNAAAWASGGFAIASENEWYKAAYYQPAAAGGDSDDYWLYPTQSNSISTADANYDFVVRTLTDVGSYSDAGSYYGTFDQGGNVWEWNDEILFASTRGLRGGSFGGNDFSLQSSSRANGDPADEDITVGFRVSSLAAVPDESSTISLLMATLSLLIAFKKGRRTL